MTYTDQMPITKEMKRSMIDDMKKDPTINWESCGNVVALRGDDETIIVLTVVKEEIVKV